VVGDAFEADVTYNGHFCIVIGKVLNGRQFGRKVVCVENGFAFAQLFMSSKRGRQVCK